MVLESFVGDILLKNDGTEVSTSVLSTDKGGVIALYFSAYWSPPDRMFTARLAPIYREIRETNKDFEIIFVSSDTDNDAFKQYHEQQPWLAVPFTNVESRRALRDKYNIMGCPVLVLLTADTGDTIITNGGKVIEDFGASGFPFTKRRLVLCKKEVQMKKEEVLKENIAFLGKLVTMDESITEVELYRMIHTSKAVAIAFIRGGCHGSNLILGKLVEIQQNIGEENLTVIIVPMMKENEDFSEKTLVKMRRLVMIPRGDRALEFADRFKPVFKGIRAPHVLVINAENEVSIRILSEDAGHYIYFYGEHAFPWTADAIDTYKEKEAAMKLAVKDKQKNLEFFTPSDTCHIVDKEGTKVSLETLQSKDVVGILFSGENCKWRGAGSLSFTPELVEMYSKCKEQGKSFEIVFLSFDKTREAFDSCYAAMPWPTLRYEDHILPEALSDVFNVVTKPALILLRGNGEIIADDVTAYAALSMGADYFPWGPEEIARGHAEKEEREARKFSEAKSAEEDIFIQQIETGKIPLRRHKGAPFDVNVGIDHVVRFGRFSTITAASAVVPNGKKAWYEVTFMEGYGISQVGWATNEFEGCDRYSSDGVGDNTDSWGFDGQRIYKWFDGEIPWGRKVNLGEDNVLGVAADMDNGKIYYGLNGDWGEPMGVAFEGLDVNAGLFPAITCSEMNIFVNFGHREMKFGPPDDSFEKVMEVV